MMRFILGFLFNFLWQLLLVAIIASIGLIYYLGGTNDGLQTDIEIATRCLPGKLQVGHAQGNLFSAFSLADVSYHNDTFDLSIRSANLQWTMNALLDNKFAINDLEVNHVRITMHTSKNTAEGPSLNKIKNLKYLEYIIAKKILISDLVFNQDKTVVNLEKLQLEKISPGNTIFYAKTNYGEINGKFATDWSIPARISFQLSGKHLVSNAQINLDGSLTKDWNVHWNVRIPDLGALIPKAQGNFVSSGKIIGPRFSPTMLTDFNIGRLLVGEEELQQLAGKINFSMQFNGSLAKPDVHADIKLVNASLRIPKLGIAPQNINLHIYGDLTRNITYAGSFKLAGNTAELQGTTNLAQSSFPTEIRLHGNNLQVINLADYKITATPDLKFHINDFKLFIDGDLTIPEAKITPKDFRKTVTLSDDIIFVDNRNAGSAAIAAPVANIPTMKVKVKLDNVLLHYQDLKATLAGELVIQTSPLAQPLATGLLYTKKGTYHAYGQVLKIKVGRLAYAGGLINNPGLNIKATRDINTVYTGSTSSFSAQQTYMGSGVLTVGVQILGTMDKPKISLISSAAGLTPDNILSYLVLGIPRSQASLSDSLAILNATSSLNMDSGSAPAKLLGLKQKLQKGLGLAELNVEKVQTFDPTANQGSGGVIGTTSLVLGKKITKNLYAHYSVSLFNSTPVSIFNLRYQLSKHWSVQSESSSLDNGADLLYSIERG